MKRQSITLLLLIFSLPSFAKVYTFNHLEEAKIFSSPKKGNYYLQIIVKNKITHKIMEEKIQSTIVYPVALHHKSNEELMVIVGPMRTADEVRKTSLQLLALEAPPPKKPLKPLKPLKPKALNVVMSSKKTISESIETTTIKKSHQWYLGAGVGAQQLNTENPIEVQQKWVPANQYWTKTNAEVLVSGEIGQQWFIEKGFLSILALGFYYNHLFPTDIGEQISVGNTNTRNYLYSWNVSSDVFLALGRATLFKHEKFLPFIEAGIGGTLNHAIGYSESPLPRAEQRENPLFINHTNSAFAYALGAGIGWEFDPHFNLSIAYQFQNLGQVHSGRAQNPRWSGGILINHTYQTNLAVLRLNYIL